MSDIRLEGVTRRYGTAPKKMLNERVLEANPTIIQTAMRWERATHRR